MQVNLPPLHMLLPPAGCLMTCSAVSFLTAPFTSHSLPGLTTTISGEMQGCRKKPIGRQPLHRISLKRLITVCCAVVDGILLKYPA
jgi:hypothetical protein